MKKAKQILTLLLAFTVLLALACGCGSGTADSGAPPSGGAASPSQAGPPAGTAPSSPTAPAQTEYGVGEYPVALPLVGEKAEISVWLEDRSFLWSVIKSFDQNLSYTVAEEETNVHVNWNFFAIGNGAEQFNVMVAGGEWPDMIFNGSSFYTGGVTKGYEDGVFMRLNDLIKENMPNYMSYLDDDPGLMRDGLTDDGDMLGILSFTLKQQGFTGGMMIRDDWVKKLGFALKDEMTFDEYTQMLTAMKTQLGVKSPLLINVKGSGALSAAFDVVGAMNPDRNEYPFYQVQGKVKFGPYEENYKAYLQLLHDWYKAGIFDSDFVTFDGQTPTTKDIVFKGNSGYFTGGWESYDEFMAQGKEADPEFSIQPAPTPLKAYGQELYSYNPSWTRVEAVNMIFQTCRNPELVCRWADYMFSARGFLAMNYGKEGLSYEMKDGKPQFIDSFFTDNTYVPGISDSGVMMIRMALLGTGVLEVRDVNAFDAFYSQTALSANEVWRRNCVTTSAGDTYVYPKFATVAIADSEEYSSKLSEISTYVQQCVPQFIMGDMSLDGEWNGYISTLKDLGMDRMLEIKQNAYDAYRAR